MLFKMRYRKPAGVVEDCIEAPDLERAELAGREFCQTTSDAPGYKFIYVRPLVVASWQEPAALDSAKPNGKARVGA